MKTNSKLFAFKLSAKEETKKEAHASTNGSKWKVRDGVSIAGCSKYGTDGEFRGPHYYFGGDLGAYC